MGEEQLIKSINQLLKEWNDKNHCLCHLLARFLRVIKISDHSLHYSILSYCNLHTCKNKKYYYKLINQLILQPSFSSYEMISSCLLKEEDWSSSWFILSFFNLAQVFSSIDCLEVFKNCTFEELLVCISEKDTIMLSVVISLLNYSLHTQNAIGLYFFDYLLQYYENDIDLFISMLDESPDVLLLFTTLCKLINYHLDFTDYSTLLSFLNNILDAFIHLEKTHTLSISLQPLINRISHTIDSF